MQNENNVWKAVAAVALVIAVIAGFVALNASSKATEAKAGATTPGTRFPNGLTIGKPEFSPTNVAKRLVGTCTLVNAASAITATSSLAFTCAATGARTTDNVVTVTPGNSSASAWGGFIVGSASVTATDVITVNMFNYTGTATSSYPLATTSAKYTLELTQ